MPEEEGIAPAVSVSSDDETTQPSSASYVTPAQSPSQPEAAMLLADVAPEVDDDANEEYEDDFEESEGETEESTISESQ